MSGFGYEIEEKTQDLGPVNNDRGYLGVIWGYLMDGFCRVLKFWILGFKGDKPIFVSKCLSSKFKNKKEKINL